MNLIKNHTLICITAFAIGTGITNMTLAQDGFTIPIEPMTVNSAISNIPVNTNLSGKLEIKSSSNKLSFNIQTNANLIDLQNKFFQITRNNLNRDDQCGQVLHVEPNTRLGYHGENSAIAHIEVHFEQWWCNATIPNNPIKGIAFQQDGYVDFKLTPVIQGNTVSIQNTVLGLGANGILGQLLDSLNTGPFIKGKICEQIPSMITIADIKKSLPPDLQNYDIQLHDVKFFDNGNNNLGLRVSGSLQVSREQGQEIFNKLISRR